MNTPQEEPSQSGEQAYHQKNEAAPRPPTPLPAGQGVEIAPGLRVVESVLRFSFSRSSGPGGQNVNKVNTRAELRLCVEDLLPPSGNLQKFAAVRLRKLAGRRLTQNDEIIIVCDEHRTQRRNRQECLVRLREILVEAQHRPRKRKKTKPSRGAVQRRLNEKKKRGEIKRKRGRVDKKAE